MESLIIPLAILLLLAAWGVWETGRKFRAEFRRRGKSWDSVCLDLSRGAGTLIVDTIWGPQKGLGHPVIWWLPNAPAPGEDLAELLTSATTLLVRCPKKLRNAEALRAQFGPQHVLVHTWAVGPTLLEPTGETR